MLYPTSLGVDYRTPAHAAIEREELDAGDGRDWLHEREVFARLCAHWFSAGPQPDEVLQRVFAAAADCRPDLLRGLTPRAVALAREESPRGKRWRIEAIFSGCGMGFAERYRAITETLRVAFSDARRPVIPRVTLNEALCVGPGGTEPPEASETLSRVLETLFRAGDSPRAVVQQTFALTGWLFRDLQLNMSLEELGALFSEERATQSWRSKVYIEGLLRAAGFKGCKAGWQKPSAACASYAAAARGNQNRRHVRRPSPQLAD